MEQEIYYFDGVVRVIFWFWFWQFLMGSTSIDDFDLNYTSIRNVMVVLIDVVS